jgi:hypothetical protein
MRQPVTSQSRQLAQQSSASRAPAALADQRVSHRSRPRRPSPARAPRCAASPHPQPPPPGAFVSEAAVESMAPWERQALEEAAARPDRDAQTRGRSAIVVCHAMPFFYSRPKPQWPAPGEVCPPPIAGGRGPGAHEGWPVRAAHRQRRAAALCWASRMEVAEHEQPSRRAPRRRSSQCSPWGTQTPSPRAACRAPVELPGGPHNV